MCHNPTIRVSDNGLDSQLLPRICMNRFIFFSHVEWYCNLNFDFDTNFTCVSWMRKIDEMLVHGTTTMYHQCCLVFVAWQFYTSSRVHKCAYYYMCCIWIEKGWSTTDTRYTWHNTDYKQTHGLVMLPFRSVFGWFCVSCTPRRHPCAVRWMDWCYQTYLSASRLIINDSMSSDCNFRLNI